MKKENEVMKIGDKVRFLNDVGGGIVRGFKNKEIAIVESDGFDIPVLIRECVVIESQNEAQVRSSVKPTETFTPTIIKEEPVEIEETKEGEKITVCLAYLPIDIKRISDTAYEGYLVNDSNYYLSFNYMSRSLDGWISRKVGIIEPNTKLFLDEFDKSQLNDIEKVCVQFIAYKIGKPFSLKNSCSVEIKVDTVKFYKLHSFKENDYFEDEALIYFVMRKDLAEKDFIPQPEEIARAMHEKETRPERHNPVPIKKRKAEIIEVDLHIDELLETTAGMSAGDMLEYQMKVFCETIDEHRKKKGQKIVFIHGKGDGVLKNAIINELKNKYKGMYYQDASFKEYGFGATMITI